VAIKVCGIVGVGLMGGSLGLALRARGVSVAAVDESSAALNLAMKRGAADTVSADPSILAGAELVVVCTPPRAIVAAAASALPHLKQGCLVCDFASIKAPIVQAIEPMLTSAVRYLGLHPMCGTAGQGIEAAQEDLFAGAVLIATPTARTESSALAQVDEFARLLGMRLVCLSPEVHDRQIAAVSHVPYLVSVALTRLAPGVQCAGPAFRDATRVATSPPVLWEQILSMNRSHLLAAVEQLCEEIKRLGNLQGEALESALDKARELRLSWERILPPASSAEAAADAKEKDQT